MVLLLGCIEEFVTYKKSVLHIDGKERQCKKDDEIWENSQGNNFIMENMDSQNEGISEN